MEAGEEDPLLNNRKNNKINMNPLLIINPSNIIMKVLLKSKEVMSNRDHHLIIKEVIKRTLRKALLLLIKDTNLVLLLVINPKVTIRDLNLPETPDMITNSDHLHFQ
jgi:hypothetical protein